ncbi:MAG: YvcK family protein, partial [Betaproteobacteria bacterium]|nr:YvcK family protein [Betaproteobacteria bacterium]
MGTVVALAGQVGGAKLAEGLQRLRGRDLCVIVNTADDYEHLGLSFSPDLDTVLYMLAGMASASAGWEPEGETRSVHGMMKLLGGPDRPVLGDKGLAAALLRTQWLQSDRRLTQVTLEFARRLGVQARILPMSDDPVRTMVTTEDGPVTFNEYFHELGCDPAVRAFSYPGAAEARIPDEII